MSWENVPKSWLGYSNSYVLGNSYINALGKVKRVILFDPVQSKLCGDSEEKPEQKHHHSSMYASVLADFCNKWPIDKKNWLLTVWGRQEVAESAFQFTDGNPLLCPHIGNGVAELPGVSLKALISFLRGVSSWPQCLPKPPSSTTIL